VECREVMRLWSQIAAKRVNGGSMVSLETSDENFFMKLGKGSIVRLCKNAQVPLHSCFTKEEDMRGVYNKGDDGYKNDIRYTVIFKCGYGHRLERGGGVGQAKEHDKGFIETSGGAECGFPFVTFLDADFIVTPAHIEFGEILSF
jgi:hypothetical protein